MTKEQKLLHGVPLMEFFKERLQTALVNQQVEASAVAEFYLANLLQEFRKSENLFEREGEKLQEKPLALLLAEASEGDVNTKIRLLKQLGDISLYTAGFFSERIRRKKAVSVEYYMRMGGGAYHSLSDILNRQKTFAELYTELAQLFPKLVGVLAEVATASQWRTNQDLLRLYEKWLATGDAHLETLLQQEGITTDKDSFNKPQ